MSAAVIRLTFLLIFLALWGLISFTIIFRKEESPRELAVLDPKAIKYIPKNQGFMQVKKPRPPQSFEERHPDLVFNGSLTLEARALAQRVQDIRDDLGSSLASNKPIIQQKTYKRLINNIEWQKEEVKRNYPGANTNRLHGILEPSYGVDWIVDMKHPLNRDVPDIRPSGCSSISKYYENTLSIAPVSVIIIFCNEWPELLLRSVHSVLNTSPPELLKEIILVDDMSNEPELVPKDLGGSGHLQEYIKGLPKTRYVRLHERQGIVGARLRGIHEATGDNFIILDSHVEAVRGWLQPLAFKMTESPTSFVMPVIDGIDANSYEPRQGGIGCTLGMIWKLMEHGMTPSRRNPKRLGIKPTEWQTSPTHAGGLFGANIEMFFDLGGYDPGMSHWGTENIELSFRLWQCGAQLECTECSHVHHLFGGRKRWSSPMGTTMNNKVRTLSVWMDRYAHLSYLILGQPVQRIGPISDRLTLRNNLQCYDFQWFLDNVWPESDVTNLTRDVPYVGPIKSKVDQTSCIGKSKSLKGCGYQWMYFAKIQVIHPTLDDEYCLTHRGTWSSEWCSEGSWAGQKFQVDVLYDQGEEAVITLKHIDENKCVAALDGFIDLRPCNVSDETQHWLWERYNPPAVFTPPI